MTRPRSRKAHPPLREARGAALADLTRRLALAPVDAEHLRFAGHTLPVAAVLAALEPHVAEARLATMRSAAARRLHGLVLGVEDLHKSHNGVACLRTAEALGVGRVVALERTAALQTEPEAPRRAHRRDPTSRRVTRHAHRWLDLHHVADPAALRACADGLGARIFGATPRGARTVETLPIDRPVMLLFGNELEGLRPDTESVCDDTFRLPMYGFTESLNVSVAVGMALHTVGERRRAALAPASGDLDPAHQQHLLARWLLADLRAGPEILAHKLGLPRARSTTDAEAGDLGGDPPLEQGDPLSGAPD